MNSATCLWRHGAAMGLAALSLAACASVSREPAPTAARSSARTPATMRPYQVRGRWYYPKEQPRYDEKGVGSWYGDQFHNRSTSNGEVFDMNRISAAHKTLPLPSIVEVTNLDNGKKLRLRVNDRGPFVDDRIIDLSRAAADKLGYRAKGVANVRVRYVGPADPGEKAEKGGRINDDDGAPIATPKPVRNEPRAPHLPMADTTGYKVQAAAFASRDNAARAAARFERASIEPADSDGRPIWRVILGPAPDEPSAWALRDQAAAQGFPDARVLRP